MILREGFQTCIKRTMQLLFADQTRLATKINGITKMHEKEKLKKTPHTFSECHWFFWRWKRDFQATLLAERPARVTLRSSRRCDCCCSCGQDLPPITCTIAECAPLPTPISALIESHCCFLVCRHPLFPLMALLFEKCEQASQSADCPSADSFDLDIQQFVHHQEQDGKPFFSEDPELDSLVRFACWLLRRPVDTSQCPIPTLACCPWRESHTCCRNYPHTRRTFFAKKWLPKFG